MKKEMEKHEMNNQKCKKNRNGKLEMDKKQKWRKQT